MKETILYKIGRPIIKFIVSIFIRPEIVGSENIPKEGKVILAGNHTNNLDCLLLMSSTKRCIHFLAKKELWSGSKKIIFSNMGLIPVDRSKKDHNAIPLAEQCLKKEQVVGIFPEGTTEKERGILPFKIGTVKIANDTNSLIVPFSIKGKYKMFSKDLKIVFGKPYKIDSKDLDKENNKLRKIIIKMLGD